jgi:uncharacterized protein YbaP (TraB family)
MRCSFRSVFFYLLVASMTWVPLAGRAQPDAAILWKVTSAELSEPSYLLGTYHLLTDSYFHTLSEAREPFAQASAIVVETVIDSSRISGLAGHMMMPGQKLSRLLSAADFERVSDELARVSGMQLAQLDMMKPATVAILITMGYAQLAIGETLRKYPGNPMDYHVAATAKRLGKTVTQLETMEEQFAILYNTFSIEEQARQLVALVDYKELAAAAQGKLLDLYLARDIHGLHAYAEQMPEDFGDSDFLLKNRNEKWMRVLPALMKRESQFIAVGALHLPGPDGLIARLQQAGFQVVPVTP